MSRILCSLACICMTLAIVTTWDGDSTASASSSSSGPSGDGETSRPPVRRIKQAVKKPRKKGSPKKGARPAPAADKEDAPKEGATKPAEGAADGLKFSRDIAPILVGNCSNCHNERAMAKNGKFDLGTFDKLMNLKAGSGDVVVVPGKPEESHLYLRLTGEETPRMPRGGGNRRLSEAAIEKIGQWIKEGARLDAGIDPKASIASYASSPDQLRRDELAKMTPEQRDKLVETKGLERWKKGNSKATPTVTPGKSFMLFGVLPKDRVTATLKLMEAQYAQIKGLTSGNLVQKIGIYVFNERTSFVEFVRSNENREIEATELGTANLADSEPYLAVLDPLGGRDEPPPAAAKKRVRTKKVEEDAGGATRSLGGVLSEYLASGMVRREGKAPIWLSSGLGAFFGERVDPRSPYAIRLRRDLYDQLEQGWISKASDALGGETKPEAIRAVGFGIVGAILSNPQSRQLFPSFVREMLDGGEKLDEVVQNLFGMNRNEFLQRTGEYVEARSGRGR